MLIIQTRDVSCTAGGPNEEGKWTGWIELIDHDRMKWKPLVNSAPIYNSEQEAFDVMRSVVGEVRDLDLYR